MANVFMLEKESPLLEIPDINSYNLYFGWYVGEMIQTDEFFDEYHSAYPDRCIGFSEYGRTQILHIILPSLTGGLYRGISVPVS